jgi:hypothetical protein
LLTKYALIISQEPLLIQPKYLFETSYFDKYIKKLSSVIRYGLIEYTGYAPDFEISEKMNQYKNHDLLLVYSDEKSYEEKLNILKKIRWKPRLNSSSHKIIQDWHCNLHDNSSSLLDIIKLNESGFVSIDNVINDFNLVPERLQDEAFVLSNIQKVLEKKLIPQQALGINFQINKSYLLSYLQEYKASILVATPLADLDCYLDEELNYTISFRDLQRAFTYLGLRELIEKKLSWIDLMKLRQDLNFNIIMSKLFESGVLDISILERKENNDLLKNSLLLFKDNKYSFDEIEPFLARLCEKLELSPTTLYAEVKSQIINNMTENIFNIHQEGATIGVGVATEGSEVKFIQYAQQNINLPEKDLVEAVRKIENLLRELSVYPTDNNIQKQTFIQKFVELCEATPDLIKVILAGGIEGLKVLCPIAGIPIEMSRSLYESLKKTSSK